MKHTPQSFAAHKKAATVCNNLPLPVAYVGKKIDNRPTAMRDGLEERSKFLRTSKGVRNIETTQAKIWGGK